jgi:glycosyltransferase involved in cell wall biosynthesis
MTDPIVSILISTRDRAPALRETLASLAAMAVPGPGAVELMLVDNGSSDETAAVIEEFHSDTMRVRAFSEPRPGKSRALNRLLEAAEGDIFLFTDDDVRVPRRWVERMTRPILQEGADAAVGGMQLASYLAHETMNPRTKAVLADTVGQLDPDRPGRLVGGNMAVHRRVFDIIPGFDVDLGPGGLGFEEDTLLGLQIVQSGMQMVGALDVVVEHCPDRNRIDRAVLQSIAERVGRSDAHVAYHWRHEPASRLRSRAALIDVRTRLALRRLIDTPSPTGLDEWEHGLLHRKGYHQQMLTELGSPRKYDRLDLAPRSAIPEAA